MDDLFERHRNFWGPFFSAEEELNKFILEKLDYTENLVPRRMLNSVQRLVTLADEIDIVRPGRRDLSIFFIVTCIESLYQYIPKHGLKKQEMIIKFFECFTSETDKMLIEQNIKILSVNEVIWNGTITMEQFALLLTSIRNAVAHEGNYWSFSFKDEDDEEEYRVLNILNSKLRKDDGYKVISYEVGLTYIQFREICIRTFINFLNYNFDQVRGS